MTEKAPEEIAAEIRATRRKLAATIDAVAARTDVRSRARVAFDRRMRALRAAMGRVGARLRGARRS